MGGAGIVFTEATHVSDIGRITPYCLGLWNAQHQSLLTRLASIVDVAGLPALSVPAGLSPSGLPTGVQVIGRRYEETAVLRVGAAIEMPLPDPP